MWVLCDGCACTVLQLYVWVQCTAPLGLCTGLIFVCGSRAPLGWRGLELLRTIRKGPKKNWMPLYS